MPTDTHDFKIKINLKTKKRTGGEGKIEEPASENPGCGRRIIPRLRSGVTRSVEWRAHTLAAVVVLLFIKDAALDPECSHFRVL